MNTPEKSIIPVIKRDVAAQGNTSSTGSDDVWQSDGHSLDCNILVIDVDTSDEKESKGDVTVQEQSILLNLLLNPKKHTIAFAIQALKNMDKLGLVISPSSEYKLRKFWNEWATKNEKFLQELRCGEKRLVPTHRVGLSPFQAARDRIDKHNPELIPRGWPFGRRIES